MGKGVEPGVVSPHSDAQPSQRVPRAHYDPWSTATLVGWWVALIGFALCLWGIDTAQQQGMMTFTSLWRCAMGVGVLVAGLATCITTRSKGRWWTPLCWWR